MTGCVLEFVDPGDGEMGRRYVLARKAALVQLALQRL